MSNLSKWLVPAVLSAVAFGTVGQPATGVHRCKVGDRISYQQAPCEGGLTAREATPHDSPPTTRQEAGAEAVRTPTAAPDPKAIGTHERPAVACPIPRIGGVPQDAEVHVVGAYSGAPIPEPIDSSGHRAGRMNVDVNSPDRPIALVLAAYDPVVWIIRKTKGTRLVGVWATGYHLPIVAGTGPEVPIVVNHYGQFNSCAVYSSSQGSAHALAKAGFNREATLYHDLTTIKTAQIGGPLRPGQAFEYAGPDYKALIDPNLEPGGEAGLRRRESAGEMRRATLEDVHRWRAWIASCIRAPKMPPLARPAAPEPVYVPSNAWVVLRPTSYPPGLFGAHAAVFYIFKGVPSPTGDRGHSTVNDANQMACVPAPVEQGKQLR